MFQLDQARVHIATANTEILEEYNINFIEWPPTGADLSPYRVVRFNDKLKSTRVIKRKMNFGII